MDKIKTITTFFQNISVEQLTDVMICLIIIIGFLIISPIITHWIMKILYKNAKKEEIRQSTLYKTLRTFLNLTGVYIGFRFLNLKSSQVNVLNMLYRIVLIWSVANLVVGIFELKDVFLDFLDQNTSKTVTKKDRYAASIIARIVKIVLYIIAIYLTLKEFGYDLGGLAAGLGVSSAVVALAAQDLFKQLFAGVAIVMDKPFELGDWVKIGDIEGNVIEVSIRCVKIKTNKDKIVTLENAKVIDEPIINSGKIKKKVYEADLNLPLTTTEKDLEQLVNRLKFVLKYNRNIYPKSEVVETTTIKNTGINIHIWIDIKETDYNKFQRITNELNYTILNILETMGIKLAYPGNEIYIKENVNPIDPKETEKTDKFEIARKKKVEVKAKEKAKKKAQKQALAEKENQEKPKENGK